MALKSLRTRIKKAQAGTHAGEALGRLAASLASGAFYDELTDEEKNAYCAYHGSERHTFEALTGYACGSLHFPIERRQPPPTEEQFRERVREMEAIMQDFEDRYNDPQAIAKREAEYQEIQRIGALRKAAFDRGESWDALPLPWEKAI